jgi:HEAT repeat protein
MPSLLTVGFLETVIVIGVAVAAFLLLATVCGRVLRDRAASRRSRAEQLVRPLVLPAVSGDEIPSELIAARGAKGRAAERVVFSYLAQVRGEAHERLTEVLQRRGRVARILTASHRRRRNRRASAAEQLGLIATQEAERRLAELVCGERSLEVRIVATRSLGKTNRAPAAVALLQSLSRPDPVPQGVVASALLELGPEAVPALREALGSDGGGRRQRAMAADVLGLLDDMPSWQQLVDNAGAGNLEVRISAIRALGRLGVPQAAGPMIACLSPDEQTSLRAVAARALGGLADPQAAPALGVCLSDPEYWVAHNSAEALSALGPAGLAELERAADAGGSGAGHAREALARYALAHRQLPARAAIPATPPAARAEAAVPSSQGSRGREG